MGDSTGQKQKSSESKTTFLGIRNKKVGKVNNFQVGLPLDF